MPAARLSFFNAAMFISDRIIIIIIINARFLTIMRLHAVKKKISLFRLDALALSVIATATWLGGWVAGYPSQPVLYQND